MHPHLFGAPGIPPCSETLNTSLVTAPGSALFSFYLPRAPPPSVCLIPLSCQLLCQAFFQANQAQQKELDCNRGSNPGVLLEGKIRACGGEILFAQALKENKVKQQHKPFPSKRAATARTDGDEKWGTWSWRARRMPAG